MIRYIDKPNKSLVIGRFLLKLTNILSFSRSLNELLYNLIIVAILTIFFIIVIVCIIFYLQLRSQTHVICIYSTRSCCQNSITIFLSPSIEYTSKEGWMSSFYLFIIRFYDKLLIKVIFDSITQYQQISIYLLKLKSIILIFRCLISILISLVSLLLLD